MSADPRLREWAHSNGYEVSQRGRISAVIQICSGVASSVATTTSSTCSAVIVGLRPDRGSSTKPSNHDSTNQDRHLPTVGIETPSCAATSWFVKPVAQARTIRERNARACADFLRRTQRSSCSVSSDVNSSNAFGHPVIPRFDPTAMKLRRRTLALRQAASAAWRAHSLTRNGYRPAMASSVRILMIRPASAASPALVNTSLVRS